MRLGHRFPDYSLKAVKPGKLDEIEALSPDDFFMTIDSDDHLGKWRVIFFWPKNFTFVCPTEIAALGRRYQEIVDADTVLFGASTDNEFSHLTWRRTHEDLLDLPYPIASDLDRGLSTALDILTPEGVCERATFIVDPEGLVRSILITDDTVGRSTDEILRQLEALKTRELCACDWKKGDQPIRVSTVKLLV